MLALLVKHMTSLPLPFLFKRLQVPILTVTSILQIHGIASNILSLAKGLPQG